MFTQRRRKSRRSCIPHSILRDGCDIRGLRSMGHPPLMKEVQRALKSIEPQQPDNPPEHRDEPSQ